MLTKVFVFLLADNQTLLSHALGHYIGIRALLKLNNLTPKDIPSQKLGKEL